MTSRADCPENLIVRARRGKLSAEEQQLLEGYLESSATLRLAHQVGLDFSAIGEVRPGDERELLACAARVIKARHGRFRVLGGAVRQVRWLLAAAALVSTASAFGWWHSQARVDASWAPAILEHAVTRSWASARHHLRPVATPPASPRAATGDPPPVALSAGMAPTADPRERASNAGAASAVPPATAPSTTEQSRGIARFSHLDDRPPASDSSRARVTAADMLARATAARGAGRLDEAIRLLQELGQRFPGSAEAKLAHVSLGRLLLARGRAVEALQQFSSYLSKGGALVEEALLGKARALGALGRTADEQSVWRELLDRYPRSVYTDQAMNRLRRLRPARAR